MAIKIGNKCYNSEELIALLRKAGEEVEDARVELMVETPSGNIVAYECGDYWYPGIATDLHRDDNFVGALSLTEWTPNDELPDDDSEELFASPAVKIFRPEQGQLRTLVWQDVTCDEFNLDMDELISEDRKNLWYEKGSIPINHQKYLSSDSDEDAADEPLTPENEDSPCINCRYASKDENGCCEPDCENCSVSDNDYISSGEWSAYTYVVRQLNLGATKDNSDVVAKCNAYLKEHNMNPDEFIAFYNRDPQAFVQAVLENKEEN